MNAATEVGAGEERESSSGGSIGFPAALAFAVGTMVGGGVFHLSGTAINDAGPAAILAYLLSGGLMLLSALSFVAVAARARPGETGYEPLQGLVGARWRFLVMWGFVVNGVFMIPFLVNSFGDYLHRYLFEPATDHSAGIVALVVIALLNLGSATLVGAAETYVVGVKVTMLVGFILVGLWHVGDVELSPFAPEGAGGVFSAAALLFTAYTGFNVVTNMAGSIRDPERNVPRAIIGSVLVAITIYVGVVVAMLASGVAHFSPAGLGQAAEALMGDTGAQVIAVAACLSTLSGANAFLIGTSEVVHRLAEKEELPAALGTFSPKGRPVVSVVVIALLAAPLILVDVDRLVAVANVAALAAMAVVNVSAAVLARAGWPGKGLRLPGGPALPVIAAVTCVLQMPQLGLPEVAVGLALLALGLVAYHRPRPGPRMVPARAEA